jgi:hypothetical protein
LCAFVRRLLVVSVAIVFPAAGVLSAASPAAADGGLAAFLSAHRCDVVERLRMIHADPAPKDRYLVISLLAPDRGYVQCLFVEDDRRLLCEAESGFYAQAPGQPRQFRLAPDRLAALASLGFATDDTDGNYQRLIDAAGEAADDAVADAILSALYRGYGARIDSRLKWAAPLAPGKGIFLRCAPVG